MKLESRYFWIVLTLVGDSTTTNDFLATDPKISQRILEKAAEILKKAANADAVLVYTGTPRQMKVRFARPENEEALAFELPYPPFDLERHEKRGGPSGRQSAPFDDLVYAHGFLPDNSKQEKAFVIACFSMISLPLTVGEAVWATRVRRDSHWLHLVAEAEGKLADHVLPSLHEGRAVLDEAMGTPAHETGQRSRHRHDLAPELSREARGDERAALLGGLHHHHAQRQAGDHAIAHGEIARERWRARRELRHHRAALGDFEREPTVLRRIDHIHARAQHGDRAAARPERATVGGAVDAPREPRDNRDPAGREVRGEALGAPDTVLRRLARAHDRDGEGIIRLHASAHPETLGRQGNLP